MRVIVCLFVVHTVTAVWVKPRPYKFSVDLGVAFRRAGNDMPCEVCFGDEYCVQVEQARCEFYMETSNLVHEDETTSPDSKKNPQLQARVDGILHMVAEKGTTDFNECVPLVSRYTDCTKENICLGCKTCTCDTIGRWNCTETQKCRPDTLPLNVDHHTLLVVLQNLRSLINPVMRYKRDIRHPQYDAVTRAKLSEWLYGASPLNIPKSVLGTIHQAASGEDRETFIEDNKLGEHKIHSDEILKYVVNSIVDDALPKVFRESVFEKMNANRVKRWIKGNNTGNIAMDDITEWLAEMRPGLSMQLESKSINVTTPNNDTRKTPENGKTSHSENMEPEFLTFDEVLDNIAVENKNYSRRKPPLDMHSDMPIDFIYDDDNVVEYTDFIMTTNPVTETPMDGTTIAETLMRGYTEVVIDLLESAKDGVKLDDLILKDSIEAKYKPSNDSNDLFFDNYNNIEELEPSNVMKKKREVPLINSNGTTTFAPIIKQTNITTTTNINKTIETTTGHPNISHSLHGLVDSVVHPLNNVYNELLKEISELHRIRGHLLSFVHKHVNINVKGNKTALDNKVFPVYKVEDPQSQMYFRTSKTMPVYEKYALKLKKDVYDVIRDIVGIQKHISDPSKIPDDLKFLIRAMKHYVHKQGVHSKKVSAHAKLALANPVILKRNETKSISRRVMESDDWTTSTTVRDLIIEILEIIDKNMPSKNALEPISTAARKIMYRIIRQYFEDEFAQIGLRVYDPHYNLTSDLSNVGFKWRKLSSDIEVSTPDRQLYLLKMLHLVMSVDIRKMNDALTLINFARTRRMVPVDEAIGNNIVLNIEKGLVDLNNKVLAILEKTVHKKKTRHSTLKKQMQESKKKESFLKQVKSFLMNSKKDIMDLLRRNTPKSDIVKKIAGQKLDDMGKKRLNQLEKTMTKWQTHLNIIPSRYKRSAMDFDRIRRRIKNIIPKYLRGKLHPAIANKKNSKKGKVTMKPHESSVRKKKTTKAPKTTKHAKTTHKLFHTTTKPKLQVTKRKPTTLKSATSATTTQTQPEESTTTATTAV